MNFQRLKDFLDGYVLGLGIPGTDTVIYKGREEVFRYQSGYENIEKKTPVNPNALYNMYSVTKVSTAVAATQLIERGMISANDPLYEYFPEYRHMQVKEKDENGNTVLRPAKNPILVKHILSMMSGINYETSDSIKNAIKETDGKAYTQAIARAIANEPLDFDPGERFQYGLSLDVAGALIELVSGKRFSEYLKENIFEPLGMKNSTFKRTPEVYARMATQYTFDNELGYAKEDTKDIRWNFGPEFESGGAGLISCVDDQILLADALTHLGLGKNGNRILSEAAVNMMRTDRLGGKDVTLSSIRGYGYGYGVRVNMRPHLHGNLSPVGEFGWDGARMCYISSDPTNKVSIFHAEQMGNFHTEVFPKFRNVIYSCLDY